MNIERQKNEWKDKYEGLERTSGESYKNLDAKYNALKGQLEDREKKLKETMLETAKMKEAQNLFMDWARQQDWELPPHIREKLPQDRKFMIKAAFGKVPYGKSPAEYAFNLLYFLSLPEEEQAQLGAKTFHREISDRPEDIAELAYVTKELHELMFFFPDSDVKMQAAYGYLARGVPKFSTEPRSDWVVLKAKALNLFPVYTRVTVTRKMATRGYTYSNVRMARNQATASLSLQAERLINIDRNGRGETRYYKLKTTFDNDTGRFSIAKDGEHRWEIANYGMADFRGDFVVSNLVMDNNPPYSEGMQGIVQILWIGTCIYDSAED